VEVHYWLCYSLCSKIICLSEIQLPKLNKLGVKNAIVISLGVDDELIKKQKLINEYFVSAGMDKGRNFEFIKNEMKYSPLKILDGNPFMPYKEYLKILAGAKAIILNIDIVKLNASDLSGTTTCFEALLLKKPIFINYQLWLKELLKDNYYVYENGEELRKLLNKNIKFKERDYEYLTLKYFTQKLMQEINKTFIKL